MPIPDATMAALAARLGHIDPSSETEIDTFYSEVFPSYTEEARSLIFSWLSATDVEASPDELTALVLAVEPHLSKDRLAPEDEMDPEERSAPSMW